MYRFINDRSDLDEVIAIIPKGHPENKTDAAIQVTRRQDLERCSSWPRNDVVLFSCTRSGRQYSLHVTETDFAGDTWIIDMLTDEEYWQVLDIAAKMRENAKIFPPAKKLIVDDSGVSH